ncbi:ABC transporter permease [Peterkaempfera bronchialis]|uniref:ABC transporter permease n=1 Tax=Peterkaempfera bronchialis TaxID=2126346 RepID=A0A345T4P8_9ACTN|nr:ABC transporter permease [Peterkaempfera bronchialis]AXI80953.1 ABC transporter permease [Peterkaempfera bronchialis]
MLGFLFRRLLGLVATLIVASFLIFSALYLAPGRPETFLTQGRSISPEALASIRAQYHLDEPFPLRYWDWITGVVRGDLGQSLVFRQDVSSLLAPRVGSTLLLTLYAAVLIVVFGVLVGVVSGLRGGLLDTTSVVVTSMGFAVPTFFAALLLMDLFSVQLGWFPVFGSGEGLADRLWHLTLPAIALAIPSGAVVARITRTSIMEEKESEHVAIATGRGLPRSLVVRRHVLRNALLPVTTIVGVNIAALIAGATVVEKAFSLDGLGSALVDAVNQKDFAVVQAIALALVVSFGLVNLAVDVLYAWLDPRFQLGGKR